MRRRWNWDMIYVDKVICLSVSWVFVDFVSCFFKFLKFWVKLLVVCIDVCVCIVVVKLFIKLNW